MTRLRKWLIGWHLSRVRSLASPLSVAELEALDFAPADDEVRALYRMPAGSGSATLGWLRAAPLDDVISAIAEDPSLLEVIQADLSQTQADAA